MIGLLGRLARQLRAGVEKTASHDYRLRFPADITVTSEAFDDGAPVPLRYLGFGDGVSPPLRWRDIPEDAMELVLIVEDADAPLPRPIVHALASGIDPSSPGLPTGALNLGDGQTQRWCNGIGAFGKRGHLGPKPVPGHGTHRYLFQLFALDAASGLGPQSRRTDALDAMILAAPPRCDHGRAGRSTTHPAHDPPRATRSAMAVPRPSSRTAHRQPQPDQSAQPPRHQRAPRPQRRPHGPRGRPPRCDHR